MVSLVDVLKSDSESLPEWLQGDSVSFDRSAFFSSRTLYYPGSGNDGHPVKICARSHAAHAFVYVDYGVDAETICERVHDADEGFRGYTVKHEEQLTKTQLRPDGWKQHILREELPGNPQFFANVEPFAWFVVLRRNNDEGYDDEHGPERLAGLFVGGDGHATFDALYCQNDGTPAPFMVVTIDHGFGGDYSRFGRGGILNSLANSSGKHPKWLLVGENTEPWLDYELMEATPERGGMHGTLRCLYSLISD